MAYESYLVFNEPLCLIESDKDGKLMVVENVLKQISKIPMQLNVIAIAGLCRTGKSYLLNRLALDSKGFPLGSTIESKTKGIWTWCRPHPVKENEVLLLLDTEGLGDVTKGDRNHDNWIFTLATLLCSTLVYNVQGNFDQDALERLSCITEMSKHVKISDNPLSKKEAADLDLYLPLFILALRDFSLDLKKDGKEITSDEYLEGCLKLRNGPDDSVSKYNMPRMCIRKYFPRRKCFTFDRPGSKATLKDLEGLTNWGLDKEFVKDSNRFEKFVLEECHPKSLDNGQPVNGGMFATLTRAYVASIRDGKIPCIENALNMMAQIENSNAVLACVQLYVEKMNSELQLPVTDDKALADVHHRCYKEAIALFLKKAVYDENQEFQRKANEKMNAEYDNFKRRNEEQSEVKSNRALAELNKTIEEKVKNKVYACAGGFAIYQQDVMTIKDEYNKKTGLGCKKDEMLYKYLASKWIESETILQADQHITKLEKQTEIERQKEEVEHLVKSQGGKFENQPSKEYIQQLMIQQEEEIKNLVTVQVAKTLKQVDDDEYRQKQESLHQLELKLQKEAQEKEQHYQEIFEKRVKEQEHLISEGFDKLAAKLAEDNKRLHEEIAKIRSEKDTTRIKEQQYQMTIEKDVKERNYQSIIEEAVKEKTDQIVTKMAAKFYELHKDNQELMERKQSRLCLVM